jgi:acyl-CoA synthetase (AMP-forming)/AMP-acid ligase II
MAGPNQMFMQDGTVSIIQFSPEAVAAAIGRGVTYMAGVPAHYNLLFEQNVRDGIDPSAVRGCYVGGSVATRKLFATIKEHFPNADLVHGYGSTESGPARWDCGARTSSPTTGPWACLGRQRGPAGGFGRGRCVGGGAAGALRHDHGRLLPAGGADRPGVRPGRLVADRGSPP